MLYSGQPEWEQPDPNIEPDPDKVIIPRIPWDDDNPDSGDTDDEDMDEDIDEY